MERLTLKSIPVAITTLLIFAFVAAPASVAYDVPDDWETLRPIIAMLKAHGIEFDGSTSDLARLLNRLSRRAGLAAYEAEKTGFDKLFILPTETAETAETEVVYGDTITYGVGTSVDFSTRLFWFEPMEYSKPSPNKEYDLGRIPMRQELYFRTDATNYIDTPDEAMEKAASYIRSGEYEGIIDRDLAKRVLAEIKYEEDIIEWEREAGLIRDFELPYDSELKFEGRKLFTMGYSRTQYDNESSSGAGDDNDINMDGELQLRIEGTIMRKTHVNVDYDDTRENENRNKISVIYKGDPDELVQEAAFGDIILSLPGTEFVSYSSSRSVFGAKVDLKYKWARLMVIASREKGKAEQTTFTGGNEITISEIDDIHYEERKYYRLNAGRNPDPTSPLDFFEYSDHTIAKDANEIPKVALYIYRPSKPIGDIDPNKRAEIYAYEFEDNDAFNGYEEHKHEDDEYHQVWERLEQATDYDINVETGIITMQTNVTEDDSLAVAYAVANNESPYYSVGYKDDGINLDFANMKLIKTSGNGGAIQRYELKNRYYLGSTSIVNNTLDIKMEDQTRSDEYNGKKYLNIFGLDRDGVNGNGDGQIDSAFIDYSFGLLIVPDDFRSGDSYYHRDRTNPDDGVPDGYNDFLPFDFRDKADDDQYNENSGDGVVEDPNDDYDAYSPGILEHKFTFHVEFQAARPSFMLRPNIVPGSEIVTLDGVRLYINRDYWIDYDSGFIEFLNEDVNEPDKVLQITYEYKPFFELSTKSLVGSRFEFGPNDYNYIGCTFLGEYSEKPRGEDKPNLGGEPANSHVFDADFSIELYPEFMTKAVDVLPLVHTNEKSKLAFEGEIARSFRNPNILGVANVEDFESAKQESSFPMRTAAWRISSAPAARAEIDQSNRTIMKWDNVTIFKDDIDTEWRTDQTDLLRIDNLPVDPVTSSETYPDTWGSIVRPLSTVGADFIDQRYDTLKITLNLNNLTASNSADDIEGGLFHIDLGEVSEDTDEDNYLDSEDGITDLEKDGELQTGEDIGWVFDNRAAGGDDYLLDGKLIRFVADNKLLDEEDMNNDDILDTNESYFTYEIDLAQVIGGTSPYVTRRGGEGSLEAGWYVLEIPLNLDNSLAETWNNPDPTRIKQIRMWFESTDETDFPQNSAINFYSIYLSSVRWEPPILDPDKGLNEVEISTKDSDSNGGDEYEPLNPITDELGDKQREQALVMNYVFNDWDDIGVTEDVYNEHGDFIGVKVFGANNGIFDTEDANHNGILDNGEDTGLGPDQIGVGNGHLDQEPPITAFTAMSNYTPDDYTDYHQMEIWVHNFKPRTDEQDYFFLRFGADEENYFEYRAQLPGGGAGKPWGWRPYLIDLDFFEKLRQKTYSLLEDENLDYISEYGHYFIKGSPSLLDIQKVIVGVGTNNPEDYGSGGFIESREVWFNDILLKDVDKSAGIAKRAVGELDFGGFIMLGGSVKTIDADFNSVGTISTSGQENTTTALNGTLEFAKFMPDDWGVRLPLSGTWSNSETITEVKYDPDQSIYTQGRVESTSKSAKISFDKYKIPSLDLGYKNSYSTNDTYGRVSDADTYSAAMNYNVFPQTHYLPRNINASFTRKVDRVNYADDADTDRNWRTDTFRGRINFEPAEDLSLEPGYTYNITVDQMDETEENFAESYSLSTRYDRIRGLRPNASYTSSYSEIVVDDYVGSGAGGLFGYGGGIMGVSKAEGEKLNLALTTSFTTSCPIDIGKLSNDKAIGINKLSISPSYSLVRGSSYNYEDNRPGLTYRMGRDHLLPDSDNLSTSRVRHTVSVNNRFNPLEFLGYRVGTKWEEWDFIQTDFDASYTWEESNTTGTPSRTRTLTFPDITNKISGVKNFPIFARMMKRSTVTVSYSRKRTLRKFESVMVKHSPSASWRATWKAGSLRTRADFGYDYTIFEYLGSNQNDTLPEKETSISPSFTVNYDWAMPRGFKIPLLGTLRWRNELNMESSVSLTQSRYENTSLDNSDRWDYSLSGGYYLTTSLHLDITGRYTSYTNLSTVGADYNTISVFGNVEIIF